jgi:ABC-type nickel/cobalt efflux system permease component RcnA
MEHEAASFSGMLSAIIVGMIIGFRHSTDGDHVVAVATMARDYNSVLKGLWVGVSWGLGHSTPLLILGILILVARESLMDLYESIAPVFEFGVALMLVFLGLQVFWKMYRGEFHVHQHEHDSQQHKHLHGTHGHGGNEESPHEASRHGPFPELIPFFRLKSYAIGVVHGLAGSAAVLVGILAATPDFSAGIAFLVFFSIGTMISMAIMTILLSIPFVLSSGSNRVGNTVIAIAGLLSIALGLALGSDLSLGTNFTGILWY